MSILAIGSYLGSGLKRFTVVRIEETRNLEPLNPEPLSQKALEFHGLPHLSKSFKLLERLKDGYLPSFTEFRNYALCPCCENIFSHGKMMLFDPVDRGEVQMPMCCGIANLPSFSTTSYASLNLRQRRVDNSWIFDAFSHISTTNTPDDLAVLAFTLYLTPILINTINSS